jgi:hypothetical protein
VVCGEEGEGQNGAANGRYKTTAVGWEQHRSLGQVRSTGNAPIGATDLPGG